MVQKNTSYTRRCRLLINVTLGDAAVVPRRVIPILPTQPFFESFPSLTDGQTRIRKKNSCQTSRSSKSYHASKKGNLNHCQPPARASEVRLHAYEADESARIFLSGNLNQILNFGPAQGAVRPRHVDIGNCGCCKNWAPTGTSLVDGDPLAWRR